MKNFIKKYLGELILIIGTGIFSYNVFNFTDTKYYPDISYYYKDGTLYLIAIGATLIVSGILIIKNQK